MDKSYFLNLLGWREEVRTVVKGDVLITYVYIYKEYSFLQ